MDRDKFASVLSKVSPGTRLRVTFKPGSGKKGILSADVKAGVMYFMMMAGKNVNFENETDRITLYAVVESGYWDHDANRKVMVSIPEGFDSNWFKQRLQERVENLEIL